MLSIILKNGEDAISTFSVMRAAASPSRVADSPSCERNGGKWKLWAMGREVEVVSAGDTSYVGHATTFL